MAILVFFILLLIAAILQGRHRQKELEKRVESLEKIHGIERYDHNDEEQL